MPRNDFPPGFRERAVALVRVSGRPISQLAGELGVSATSLQRWVARSKINAGETLGATSDDHAGMVKLRRANRWLEMENEILEGAAAYFVKENVLPKQLSD